MVPDDMQTWEPPGPSVFTFLITSHPPHNLMGEVRASFPFCTLRNRLLGAACLAGSKQLKIASQERSGVGEQGVSNLLFAGCGPTWALSVSSDPWSGVKAQFGSSMECQG